MRTHKHRAAPCNCVLRSVFRACLNRYRVCVAKGEATSTVTLEACRGRDSRRCYSRKREEYMADFFLVSRRFLRPDEWRVFLAHFVLGGDWKLCCRQFGMDRGSFFHMVYRIEQKLGRVFAELRPYALYPLEEYFSRVIHRTEAGE